MRGKARMKVTTTDLKTGRVTIVDNRASPQVSKPVSTAVKKIVKRELAKDVEIKKVYDLNVANKLQIAGSGLTYGAPVNFGWVSNSLIPNPAIGTSSAARIGNKITPKRLNVRYQLQALQTTDQNSVGANTNPYIGLPFLVKVMIYKHRYSTSDSSPNGILNDGASSTDVSGTIDSFYRPFNTDEFQIFYNKVHKLQACRHQYNTTGSVTGQTQDIRFSSYVVRSINIKLPKHLYYNDNLSAYPTNAGLYMAVAVCNEDGTFIPLTDKRVLLNAESYMSFTDD